MRTILKVALLAGVVMTAAPAFSQVYVGLGIRLAPPPLRREVVVVSPHRGWVWVAGYWQWRPRFHRYVWIRGNWVRPPYREARWIPARWEERHGEWVFFRGRWAARHR